MGQCAWLCSGCGAELNARNGVPSDGGLFLRMHKMCVALYHCVAEMDAAQGSAGHLKKEEWGEVHVLFAKRFWNQVVNLKVFCLFKQTYTSPWKLGV